MQPEITSPSDLLSFSHARNMMRLDTSRITALKSVSCRPQGMRATVDEQVEAWKEGNNKLKSPERKAGVGVHTRLGIGLPMSNIFATYAVIIIYIYVCMLLTSLTSAISADP